MKNRKCQVTLLLNFFVVALLVTGCLLDASPSEPITYTAAQRGGSAGTSTSTGIVLTFAKPITGLSAGDITIGSETGSAAKGTGIAGNGTRWIIALSDVSSEGTVTVRVNKPGIDDTVQTGVKVYKAKPPITWEAVQIDGTSGTSDSTGIKFTFTVHPGDELPVLTANDITIVGAVSKGELVGSTDNPLTWTLDVTVFAEGKITVSIQKQGIDPTPKDVEIFKASNPLS